MGHSLSLWSGGRDSWAHRGLAMLVPMQDLCVETVETRIVRGTGNFLNSVTLLAASVDGNNWFRSGPGQNQSRSGKSFFILWGTQLGNILFSALYVGLQPPPILQAVWEWKVGRNPGSLFVAMVTSRKWETSRPASPYWRLQTSAEKWASLQSLEGEALFVLGELSEELLLLLLLFPVPRQREKLAQQNRQKRIETNQIFPAAASAALPSQHAMVRPKHPTEFL